MYKYIYSENNIFSANERKIKQVVYCISVLSLSFAFCGMTSFMKYIAMAVLVVCCILLHKCDAIEYVAIPIYLFDYALVVGDSGATFNRMFLLLFFASYFIRLANKRGMVNVKKDQLFIGIWFVVVSIIGTDFSLTNLFSIVLNTIVFVIISIKMKGKTEQNIVLFAVSISAVCGALYALLCGNLITGLSGTRLSSAIGDPNFTGMLYVIGLVGTLSCKYWKGIVRYFIAFFLIYAVITTGSQTGLLMTVLVISFFAVKRYKTKGLALVVIIVCTFFVFVKVNISIDSIFYYIQSRIKGTLMKLQNGDLAGATTDRSMLWDKYLQIFFTKTNPLKMLFGGSNATAESFRTIHGIDRVSHNTLIDITLMGGIIGLAIALWWEIKRIRFYLISYIKSRDNADLGIALLKIAVFVYSLTLSCFTGKLFGCVFML